MTKVSVLGQTNKEEKELTPIKFERYFTANDFEMLNAWQDERTMDEIVLISKKGLCHGEYDVILGIKGDSQNIYLGHWNDGVV